MITLTQTAIDKIKAIVADEPTLVPRLRVKVIGGGCAGFQYDVYFDELEPTSLDEVTNSDGITVVIDPLSHQYLDGVEIDYVVVDFREGFKFNNPNVETTCGCGNSFKA